ncbi:hypothetical protein BJ085DRAFT_28074 [Dimargaris cristalligena]|uniref:Major facilitator superfamily domain-containing protein n=1 Tax=Dimargaris cristalligena TaxID=215637 RepID=A0A4P9ZNX9_9FUNG|nr:hypothetical protein BJ085DRAFT_28074 [Dimargaris cristalligena]|eukprot:RKP35144.1 hypothetical protein BJ085DRAFT_28074 [Dimargaris cristalligena]
MRSHHPPSALAQGNLRSSSSLSSEFEPIDVYSAAYWIAWPIFLGWGALDMSMNVLAYWVVANISRDANESSNYSGYLASMQYISSAIYWQFDAQHIPQIVFWLLTFMIVAVGLVAAFATGFVIDRLDKESQVFAAEVNDKQSMSSATDSFDFPTA